mgnify:CR=1 FL=1
MLTTTTPLLQRLGIAHPIVQGPFGGGMSSALLAATVSNGGGLGSFGAHQLRPDQIGPLASEVRALTARPFALNLWVSTFDAGGDQLSAAEFERGWRLFEPWYRELGLDKPEPPAQLHADFEAQFEALLAAQPAVFSFVFGVPRKSILDACRRRGIATIGAATSIAEAQALDAASVDAIVASGFEAGGHRPSFLARAEDSLMGTFALVPLIADRVRAPVIAAGGIADARGVSAALTLGAQAAQIGTAFLACAESGASDVHRQLLFSESARSTTLTRAFSGRLARGISNRWTREMAARIDELPPFPVQSWFTGQMRAAAIAQGRSDLVSLWGGQIAPNLVHRSAAELMQALTD